MRGSEIVAARRVTDYLHRRGPTSETTLVDTLDVSPELLVQLARSGKVLKAHGLWRIPKRAAE